MPAVRLALTKEAMFGYGFPGDSEMKKLCKQKLAFRVGLILEAPLVCYHPTQTHQEDWSRTTV